jgi:CheY-like chemotaxis protein
VDDLASSRNALLEALAACGATAATAGGAEEALELIERAEAEGQPFGVLLVDRSLPGEDAFSFIERVRSRGCAGARAIVLLSPSELQDGSARCRELGLPLWVTKPVRRADLRDSIARALFGGLERTGTHPSVAGKKESPGGATGSGRPLRVLLAEDNPVSQRLIVRLLEKRGHTVMVSGTGLQALEALATYAYDAVLMDVEMPGLDGFEVTSRLRARERTTGAHLPVIAMTAHALKGDREKCLAAGMDAYLTKPLSVDDLLATLNSVTG